MRFPAPALPGFRLSLLAAGLTVAIPAAQASKYDYSYGSMAYHNEAARERMYNSYVSSGDRPFTVDSRALAAKLLSEVHTSAPAPMDGPRRAPNGGTWESYWREYDAVVNRNVDRRTPQERELDNAVGGNPIAMWNAGYSYIEGSRGYPLNVSHGLYWLGEAFRHGKTEAAFALYAFFDPNHGGSAVPKDPVKALYWLRTGALAGEVQCMIDWARCLIAGVGAEKAIPQGIELLTAAANRPGGDFAAWLLARDYDRGTFGKPDLDEAIRWQKEVVRRKFSTDDKNVLAEMLIRRAGKDPAQCADELRPLIDLESRSGEMLLLRAMLAEGGYLGSPDVAGALRLWTSIAEQPKSYFDGTLATANEELANHFYEGRGVPRDDARAFHYYQAAYAAWDGRISDLARLRYALLLDGRVPSPASGASPSGPANRALAVALLASVVDNRQVAPNELTQARIALAHLLATTEITHGNYNRWSVTSLLKDAAREAPEAAVGLAFGIRAGWFGDNGKLDARVFAKECSREPGDALAYWEIRWRCEDSQGQDENWVKDINACFDADNWPAHLWIADLLMRGTYDGVLDKNPELAEQFFKTVLEKGDDKPEAESAYGAALCEGFLGEKRAEEGLVHLRHALEQSSWRAGTELARLYHNGTLGKTDEAQASSLLEKAGSLGGKESAEFVATAFEQGEIVAVSAEAAARWKAIAQATP